jgi:hypothetical protein
MTKAVFWAARFVCLLASVALMATTGYLLARPFPASWGGYERPLVFLLGGFLLGAFLLVISLASFYVAGKRRN